MQDGHPERSEGSLSGERSFAALRMTKRDGLLFEMYWALCLTLSGGQVIGVAQGNTKCAIQKNNTRSINLHRIGVHSMTKLSLNLRRNGNLVPEEESKGHFINVRWRLRPDFPKGVSEKH